MKLSKAPPQRELPKLELLAMSRLPKQTLPQMPYLLLSLLKQNPRSLASLIPMICRPLN
jgi:hypothetical protein